ncbi:MAG: hypothetical protein CM15mP62_27620 [Rhodospirillaceae bacterium]|nr:MAG: hypothetical protein CM15mP62_27620 [Rhodospirillaceae bacterium]
MEIIRVRFKLSYGNDGRGLDRISCAGTINEPKRRFCNGMFSIYLSPEAFGHSDDSFVSEVRALRGVSKSSRPTEPEWLGFDTWGKRATSDGR